MKREDKMNNELFPVEAVTMDSPRLAWMKKHDLVVWRTPLGDEIVEDEFGNTIMEWTCSECTEDGPRLLWAGTGNTEEEACIDFARKHRIPLWNEEAQP